MATADFNLIDKVVARWRLGKVVDRINQGETVLDFGCGVQGYFLKSVAGKIKSGVGLDPALNNYKIGEKLRYKDGYFDKIVMLAVLEHIETDEVKDLFKNFERVLKRDGKIILTTPTPASKFILETLAKFGIINREEIADHKKYYSKTDLWEIIEGSSLKLVSYQFFQLGLNSVAVFKKT